MCLRCSESPVVKGENVLVRSRRALWLSPTFFLTTLASAQQVVTPSILDTASPNAREISDLFWLVLGFSVFVMAVVVLFMVAGIIGGIRNRELDKEPPQTHGNLKLEIAWTVIPLIILAILLIPTLGAIYRLDGFAAPEEAIEVNIVSQQFWWEMAYVAEGIVTANELVVPVGRPVKLNLSSKDVIHSFWVPQLAGKTDAIPGNQRIMWFTPEEEGSTTVSVRNCAALRTRTCGCGSSCLTLTSMPPGSRPLRGPPWHPPSR